jgi:dTDP-4-amino-4,6-dideoxygalactose transaminase
MFFKAWAANERYATNISSGTTANHFIYNALSITQACPRIILTNIKALTTPMNWKTTI